MKVHALPSLSITKGRSLTARLTGPHSNAGWLPRHVSVDGRLAGALLIVLTASMSGARAVHVLAAGPTVSQSDSQRTAALEGTDWKATELAGKAVPTQDAARGELHLQLEANGRAAGSDSCNRITGTFKVSGDRITFGQMAATQMACLNSTGTEVPFRDALTNATRFTIAGDHLTLFDAANRPLVVFTANHQASTSASRLEGTSWQLVRFQANGRTLTPDDGAKYTIAFEGGGRLIARVDCNRGRGTWKSMGPDQIEFGPLALTRAQCPAGSLHDPLVRQWEEIRSYAIEGTHLLLVLKSSAGSYEFEPLRQAK